MGRVGRSGEDTRREGREVEGRVGGGGERKKNGVDTWAQMLGGCCCCCCWSVPAIKVWHWGWIGRSEGGSVTKWRSGSSWRNSRRISTGVPAFGVEG